ncbi:MAG TPA: 1-(5-phosphoribosyl)-5-[(5-phosphoribosylamino)methylideneamino]imidazole-4-carboxamide isomerase [Syntrophomonadaceae bacterium]|nr:1-(5-phosphoribosyl)-5-[(5-phosphoribosylamino)methylideneamino]imidazole-4-carboxamide isomerase [Syntrophomonadaceae bacterium]
MLIFPAIDLRGGKCVRLRQGREDAETVYAADPTAVARLWVERGARWLHLVDLDGAFAGEPRQLPLVERIVRSAAVPVQLGGGLRTLEQIRAAFEAGVARVILGTVAVSNPELVRRACAEFGKSRIVVGIDAREGWVAVRGWKDVTSRHFLEVAREIRELGVERLVFTDTSRDGMLSGPNFQATGELARRTGLRVIASGGISSLEDLMELKKLESAGVEGAILGKALYEGKIRLEEAISVASGKG